MAYSTIPNSEIAVGAPITNNLMTKIRDNPEAIAEGLSGATRIVEAALAAAVTAKLVTNGDTHDHNGGDGNQIPEGGILDKAISRDKLADYASGVYYTHNTEGTDSPTSYTQVGESILCGRGGTISVRMGIKTTSGFLVYGRIYKNGVAQGTELNHSGTTYAYSNQDITVSAGDLIQAYVNGTVSGYDVTAILYVGHSPATTYTEAKSYS